MFERTFVTVSNRLAGSCRRSTDWDLAKNCTCTLPSSLSPCSGLWNCRDSGIWQGPPAPAIGKSSSCADRRETICSPRRRFGINRTFERRVPVMTRGGGSRHSMVRTLIQAASSTRDTSRSANPTGGNGENRGSIRSLFSLLSPVQKSTSLARANLRTSR